MSPRLRLVTSDPILTRGLQGRVWMAGGLLGLIVGGGIFYTTPPTYTATTVVQVNPAFPAIDLNPTASRPKQFTVDSDAQLVTSGIVVQAVADATELSTEKVRESLGVSARQLTRVLQISFTAASPKTATAGAQQAAKAFLLERDRLVVQPVIDYLADVDKRSESPKQSAALTTEDLSGRAQSRVESWRQRAITARLDLYGAGTVLESARVRSGADRGDLAVPVATGAAVGALLGVGVAMLRSIVQRRRLLARERKAVGAIAGTVTT